MSQVLLLTGPPGAGKTTASKEFAKTADGTWALTEQDAIRQLVKAGFKNPSDPWTKDTEAQMSASIDICGDMAKRYQQYEINCIIDCFITLDSYTHDKWLRALEGIDYKIIVLLPVVEKAVDRNNLRTGDNRLAEAMVHNQHEEFSAWRDDPRATMVDSTNMNVVSVVQAIEDIASTKTLTNTSKKKETLDDNARKFIVEVIDSRFLEENSASSFTLIVDWLETSEDNEKKVAYKKFDNGDAQILLIAKVTKNGHRTSEKEKITEETYKELLSSSILHLEKKRYEFEYTQNDVLFSMKYDDFSDSKLCMLEIDASNAEERQSFNPADFPAKLEEVTGDMQYYGYRIADTI